MARQAFMGSGGDGSAGTLPPALATCMRVGQLGGDCFVALGYDEGTVQVFQLQAGLLVRGHSVSTAGSKDANLKKGRSVDGCVQGVFQEEVALLRELAGLPAKP